MSKFCPFCGEKLVDEAKFCKNCGKDVSKYTSTDTSNDEDYGYGMRVAEKSHTAATVIGFICAFLIPIIGLIMGIYLITRKDNSKSKGFGIAIIALSVIVWFFSFMTAMYMY